MNHQDLINTCVFEQIQGLLFSDLSGPLRPFTGLFHYTVYYYLTGQAHLGAAFSTSGIRLVVQASLQAQ